MLVHVSEGYKICPANASIAYQLLQDDPIPGPNVTLFDHSRSVCTFLTLVKVSDPKTIVSKLKVRWPVRNVLIFCPFGATLSTEIDLIVSSFQLSKHCVKKRLDLIADLALYKLPSLHDKNCTDVF